MPGEPPGRPPGPPGQPPGPPFSPSRWRRRRARRDEESDRERRASELQQRHAETTDPLARLKKLKEAYDAQLITEEEYAARRAEIIADFLRGPAQVYALLKG